uniref:RNase H type-1 domain-containing protein n=1 Tax=Fagus sylvatica TaxID=28930 RepID=A0A2N9GG55_FAGSY
MMNLSAAAPKRRRTPICCLIVRWRQIWNPRWEGKNWMERNRIPPVGVRVGVSYKESLLGEIPGAYERAFFGNSMEEDGAVYSDDEDGDPPEGGRIGARQSLPLIHQSSPVKVDIPNAEETKGFGPWMIVQRRKRQAKRAVDSGKAVLVTAKVGGDDPGTSKAHMLAKRCLMARGDIPKSTPKSIQLVLISPLLHLFLSVLKLLLGMTSTRWGLIPMLSGPSRWKIQVKNKTIILSEDDIELIRKDPLHEWGWYETELAQAWKNISPVVPTNGSQDLPLLTDLVWLQEVSPFWNFLTDMPRIDGVHCPLRIHSQPSPELRLIQFLEEVYCATLPDFDERKVILSIPIQLLWKGNRASIKLAQAAKCIPHFVIVIQCSERLSEGYLSYKFSMEAKLNTLWEMWPEKAWNALEAGGNLFPTNNPPFMSSNEIGVNVLTWNCRGVLNPCFRRALLDLAKTFPFDGFLCTNTIGFAGGIWIMWNSDMVEVEAFVLYRTGASRLTWTSPAPNLAGTFAIFTALVSAWNKLVFGLDLFFSNLVSPFQAAFVPGRRGVDNVIIAQELIHSLHKKKGRKGQFILKVDLEKAYDRLEWSFIREVLLFFNFPSRVGNLLKPLGVVLHLLLYAEASASCCHIIATVLADFCSHSGQKINLAKSKAFFSPNVTPHMRHHLCDILGVSSTPDLGKYLGFPLRIHGRNARDFRNFLWGSSEDKKKMHMVGWDKICQPKKDGGLGLYSSKPRNLALLAKLNWRLIDEKDSLWAKTLLAKYCPDGIRWVIGNGHSTSFWHDTWVGNEPLREVIHGPIPHLEESFCVVDVIEGVGVWDFSRISFTLPKIISDSIRAVSVCSFSNKEDCLAWDSSDGGFNLGKAYQLACKPSNVINGPSSWLWKVKTSPRIINQIIFKAKSILPNPAVCAVSHASEFFYLMDVKTNAKNRVLISVKWNPPPVNWAKLNTDGSVLGDPGLAGGGGVIRDSLGNWIGGFSRSIGITSCVQAELRALKDGLLLALDLEISKLEIEMDSSVAVESLKTTSMPNVFLRSIVDDCRLLLERFEATTIKHIYREANGCADALAKTGCVQHVNISFYPSAPAHVLEALAFDNSVATRTRFVLL